MEISEKSEISDFKGERDGGVCNGRGSSSGAGAEEGGREGDKSNADRGRGPDGGRGSASRVLTVSILT